MTDLISRQAAIDAIAELPYGIRGMVKGILSAVPSALDCKECIFAPFKRKTGKWLETEATPHRIYCSECFKTYIPNKEWYAWKDDIVPRNYCPNCGAKMEGEDDETD